MGEGGRESKKGKRGFEKVEHDSSGVCVCCDDASSCGRVEKENTRKKRDREAKNKKKLEKRLVLPFLAKSYILCGIVILIASYTIFYLDSPDISMYNVQQIARCRLIS
jgi:hypothetical protein